MPDFTWFVDIIKIGGPPVIILLLTAVVFLWRENEKKEKIITALHKDKENMYNQWREESAARNERLTNALHNSTLAISDHSANAEAVKISLNSIMSFMSLLSKRG